MRKLSRACAAVAASGLVLLLSQASRAQSVFDFDDWMQQIDDASQDLQRRIAERDAEAADEHARELARLYELMARYFVRRGNAADAVRWSRAGRDYATQAVADLAARNFVAAKRNALAIAHGCRDCHFNYKPL